MAKKGTVLRRLSDILLICNCSFPDMFSIIKTEIKKKNTNSHLFDVQCKFCPIASFLASMVKL